MREAALVILVLVIVAMFVLLFLRPRRGALSAQRTPTRPPAPARLVPLRPSDDATSDLPYPHKNRHG